MARFLRETRPYDVVYDATYTVPSRANFIASVQYGTAAAARHKIRPVYDTMFSAVKKDARNVACLVKPEPDVMDNFVPQYDVDGVPIIPADTGPLPQPHCDDDVTGAYRYKYALRYAPQAYKIDTSKQKFSAEDQKEFNLLRRQSEGSKQMMNRLIQTDYRESESQTDPYSPPFFLPYPGAYPQLLALVKLTWEKGLPFSLDDIVIIERALSKRMLNFVDHAVEDDQDFERRIKLLEELEAQQWADRERELDKICKRKMELTDRLLQEYSSRVAHEHTLRLERLHYQLKIKTQDNFQSIKHLYFRDLRKLEKKYLQKKASRQRDIIKDYTEFDSGIYAPLTRNGAGIDTIGEDPTDFNWNLNDLDKLDAITNDPNFIRRELTFDVDRFREKIEKCKPSGTTRRLERKLEDIYLSFKDHGMKAKEQLNFLEGSESGHNRSSSAPEIAIECDIDEEYRKPHVILLQKIARGRAAQKEIRDEMDKNMTEILALKRMWDMDPNCQRMSECELQRLMALKKKAEAEEGKDTSMEEVVGHLEGETLARMIDFLDKEMVRLIDERKIHALILLAERERKLKEAAEGGRRFKEEEKRRALDEVFKQVTGIHQATVDMYLEEIFLESCDRVADDQSRLHVQKLATVLNDALNTTQRTTLSDFEQEELAADLVSSFMIPELNRLHHNARINATGGRYEKAANQVLDAVFSAHPATIDVMDELEPIVEEALQRGIAAVDGGVELVDLVIDAAADMVASQKAHEDLLAAEEAAAAAAEASAAAAEAAALAEELEAEEDAEREREEEEEREREAQNAKVTFGQPSAADDSYIDKVFGELRIKALRDKLKTAELAKREEDQVEVVEEEGRAELDETGAPRPSAQSESTRARLSVESAEARSSRAASRARWSVESAEARSSRAASRARWSVESAEERLRRSEATPRAQKSGDAESEIEWAGEALEWAHEGKPYEWGGEDGLYMEWGGEAQRYMEWGGEGEEADDETGEGEEEAEGEDEDKEEAAAEVDPTTASGEASQPATITDQVTGSDESPPPPPKLPIVVSDDVYRRLAAKSVQLEFDTEIGQHIHSAFFGAHATVNELFGEVKQKIGGPKTDESGSDATLSDDTDD